MAVLRKGKQSVTNRRSVKGQVTDRLPDVGPWHIILSKISGFWLKILHLPKYRKNIFVYSEHFRNPAFHLKCG